MAVIGAHLDRSRFRLNVVPVSVVILILYCGASAFWAVDPSNTFRRLILTALVIWTIFLTISQVNTTEATDAIRVAMICVLLVNFLAVLTMPDFGIHQVGEVDDPSLIGDWRGFMMQKNFTGAFCAFTILYFLFGTSKVGLLVRCMTIALSFFFLFKTGSKTSLALLILSIGIGAISLKYSPRYRAVAVAVFILAILSTAIFTFAYWKELTAPFDSEDALTGRVQIWPVLVAYWHDHPLAGAGYGSFWNIGANSPIFAYTKFDSWVGQITSGHNGYLDLLVQIGLPGLILAVIVAVIIPIVKLLANTHIGPQHRSLILSSLLFCAGHNMTESSLLDRDSIVQVFLVIALALLQHTDSQETAKPD